jgi:hypothetical protein
MIDRDNISHIEAKLYAMSALRADSKAAAMLAQYRKARSHLAFLTLAAAAPVTGFNVAAPDAEMAGLTREQCTALAREAMEYLQSLIP